LGRMAAPLTRDHQLGGQSVDWARLGYSAAGSDPQ
jgi:hypothetical protein